MHLQVVQKERGRERMREKDRIEPTVPCFNTKTRKDCEHRSATCRRTCVAWAAYESLRNEKYITLFKESNGRNNAFLSSRAAKNMEHYKMYNKKERRR